MSQTFLNIIELPNGNLHITATPEGLEYLEDRIAATQDELGYQWQRLPSQMWGDLMESYSINGSYGFIEPEKIGALTEAPIIANYLRWNDEGVYLPVDAKVWHYNDYMTTDELYLLHSGQPVIFTKA